MSNDRHKYRIPFFDNSGKFIGFEDLDILKGVQPYNAGVCHRGEPEQCTGLTDKHGKLIYKGDIIKVVDGCVHLGKTFEVVDCMIRWEMRDLSNDEYDTLMCGCCVEIIGTIHDEQFHERG